MIRLTVEKYFVEGNVENVLRVEASALSLPNQMHEFNTAVFHQEYQIYIFGIAGACEYAASFGITGTSTPPGRSLSQRLRKNRFLTLMNGYISPK
jgi:hypothetical protein